MRLKVSSAEGRPFCLGLNELNCITSGTLWWKLMSVDPKASVDPNINSQIGLEYIWCLSTVYVDIVWHYCNLWRIRNAIWIISSMMWGLVCIECTASWFLPAYCITWMLTQNCNYIHTVKSYICALTFPYTCIPNLCVSVCICWCRWPHTTSLRLY